jgi:hypothetical protein
MTESSTLPLSRRRVSVLTALVSYSCQSGNQLIAHTTYNERENSLNKWNLTSAIILVHTFYTEEAFIFKHSIFMPVTRALLIFLTPD